MPRAADIPTVVSGKRPFCTRRPICRPPPPHHSSSAHPAVLQIARVLQIGRDRRGATQTGRVSELTRRELWEVADLCDVARR
jgi:hypothetical protein